MAATVNQHVSDTDAFTLGLERDPGLRATMNLPMALPPDSQSPFAPPEMTSLP